jgi:uncharacterized protein YodC (DUF2158 family)
MTNGKFKRGELVRIKSGGPVMTVQETFFSPGRGTEYRCEWYLGDQYKCQIFPGDSLERISADELRECLRNR